MKLVMTFMAAALTAGAPVITTPPARLSVILYDQPDYKGRALMLSLPTADLKALKFDDKVASLVIQGAGDWVLCEHRNYAGRCIRVQSQAGNLKLLQLNGRVSSLYPVPAPVPPSAATTPAGK
ncbi:MAG: beta/gamma crystallin-related protein [Alphaproteobacteria bacterium]|nr:beta/gamma crystallin-related protein [Alphaproteobacteria bacterium]